MSQRSNPSGKYFSLTHYRRDDSSLASTLSEPSAGAKRRAHRCLLEDEKDGFDDRCRRPASQVRRDL